VTDTANQGPVESSLLIHQDIFTEDTVHSKSSSVCT